MSNVAPATLFSDMQRNAVTCYAALSSCPGLTPVMPCGAMYMMVKIDIEHFPEFASDVNFTEKMVTEQSVFCLPATVCLSAMNLVELVNEFN